MVAIMGPSGSGKTSLLNVLAGRLKLSKGSSFTGQINVNGRRCKSEDFGKFGAFVQQDDILIPTMTPRECFKFALKISNASNSLSVYEIEVRVKRMISRLRLEGCADTKIGGGLVKGISGGERKRTSIGYELITNPSLLLMDEPTSGLDSDTALKIMRLVQNEAKQRGMTILSTIHMPSSELLQIFDRVIILAEGMTIFNGPVGEITEFFERNGFKLGHYQNPADVMLKLASHPQLLNPELTLKELFLDCRLHSDHSQMPKLGQSSHLALKRVIPNTRFTQIGESRSSSCSQQFALLFKRGVQYQLRNPKSFLALVAMGLINSFVLSSIFHDVGSKRLEDPSPLMTPEEIAALIKHNTDVVNDYVGLVFFVSIDQFVTTSLSQVMQIPNLRPVFVREHANKMYSASAYYLSGWLSSTLALLFYPLMCGSISFYFVSFADSSFENFLSWIGFLVLIALQGSTYGFLFGCILDNEEAGINWLQYSDMVFLFGSGFYVNLKTANWLIQGIGYVSPFRYSTEYLLRILLHELDYVDSVCDKFDFNLKQKCIWVSLVMLLLYFLGGWLVVVLKARYQY
uniref:ABC transporter domain-containing protein n=1 Tax=Strombidium rassoulzadegani TaxID=1082188 RepID=A0A7S3CL40_9SPIT|mmetsp:Transcript_14991/g.25503  ORF Transcript_14991/g.25503 Transcript_14991/m.25503 type:complete len:573 (+) Transcript_14991:736-2454(+)